MLLILGWTSIQHELNIYTIKIQRLKFSMQEYSIRVEY